MLSRDGSIAAKRTEPFDGVKVTMSCSTVFFKTSGDFLFLLLTPVLLSSTALSSLTICPYILSSLTRFCCLVSIKSSRLLAGDNMRLLAPMPDEASVVDIVPEVKDRGIPVFNLSDNDSGNFKIGYCTDACGCPKMCDRWRPVSFFEAIPVSEIGNVFSVDTILEVVHCACVAMISDTLVYMMLLYDGTCVCILTGTRIAWRDESNLTTGVGTIGFVYCKEAGV